MSLGVVVHSPEGLVVAAESRVTLTATMPAGTQFHVNFDNATKLVQFHKPHNFVGVVTWGAASIQWRTVHSFVPEIEAALPGQRLTIREYTTHLANFLGAQWAANVPSYTGDPMIVTVAGFDLNQVYGEVWQVSLPQPVAASPAAAAPAPGTPASPPASPPGQQPGGGQLPPSQGPSSGAQPATQPPPSANPATPSPGGTGTSAPATPAGAVPVAPKITQIAAPGRFGLMWGGQAEIVHRIVHGYDQELMNRLRKAANLTTQQEAAVNGVIGSGQLQIPIAAMSLQDCVDLAVFLIRSTIAAQRLTVGLRGCGGAVDVAVITRNDGLTFIRRKVLNVAEE